MSCQGFTISKTDSSVCRAFEIAEGQTLRFGRQVLYYEILRAKFAFRMRGTKQTNRIDKQSVDGYLAVVILDGEKCSKFLRASQSLKNM